MDRVPNVESGAVAVSCRELPCGLYILHTFESKFSSFLSYPIHVSYIIGIFLDTYLYLLSVLLVGSFRGSNFGRNPLPTYSIHVQSYYP